MSLEMLLDIFLRNWRGHRGVSNSPYGKVAQSDREQLESILDDEQPEPGRGKTSTEIA